MQKIKGIINWQKGFKIPVLLHGRINADSVFKYVYPYEDRPDAFFLVRDVLKGMEDESHCKTESFLYTVQMFRNQILVDTPRKSLIKDYLEALLVGLDCLARRKDLNKEVFHQRLAMLKGNLFCKIPKKGGAMDPMYEIVFLKKQLGYLLDDASGISGSASASASASASDCIIRIHFAIYMALSRCRDLFQGELYPENSFVKLKATIESDGIVAEGAEATKANGSFKQHSALALMESMTYRRQTDWKKVFGSELNLWKEIISQQRPYLLPFLLSHATSAKLVVVEPFGRFDDNGDSFLVEEQGRFFLYLNSMLLFDRIQGYYH